jgi:hypothetical protein
MCVKDSVKKLQSIQVRACVPLTQLVILNFRELLDSTLMKVVTGYITREFWQITSFWRL